MKNYIQDGDVMELTAPYDRLGGEGAQVGSLFGVSLSTVLNGVSGPFCLKGVHELKKTSAQAWTQGVKLYWDDVAKECTTAAAAGANLFIGHAAMDAANPTATGMVRLCGASA